MSILSLYTNIVASSVPVFPLPGDRENECTSSEESSSSAVIAVSAVSLLLIVTLTKVILTQCLLIIRMRRRSRNKTETYAEVTNPTTNTTDVSVSPNEAYGLTKITRPREEVTYELVNRSVRFSPRGAARAHETAGHARTFLLPCLHEQWRFTIMATQAGKCVIRLRAMNGQDRAHGIFFLRACRFLSENVVPLCILDRLRGMRPARYICKPVNPQARIR